jgi:hypothetical protein
MPKPIEAGWESYRREVIPADAPAVQVSECRRSFFAGAQAVLSEMNAISEPNVSEAEGVRRLEGMHRECRAFCADVKAGRA